MNSPFLGELLGTMTLILLGDGVVAAVLLNRSKAQNAGWIVITTGWALAVMCGVFVSATFGGFGHINPAVTLGALWFGPVSPSPISPETAMNCVAGQFAGAFLGAVLVWIHYHPHWRETPDPAIKLAVFCTGPAIRSPAANFVSEMLGTFVLVFVAGAIGHAHPAEGVSQFLIGALVWSIGLSLGATTGYAINPARDLGPRIAHALLPIDGKGPSDWAYAWVPVLGPIAGGALGTVAFTQLSAVG